MATVTPRTLSGFMELLPAPQQQMERMMEILRTTYSRYGFTPLDTPAIEASEVLLAKGGGETEKQIYRFQKGDADLSLRFDLTVPLAKYVALHYNDLAFPFRRYQIGKVYRGERAQRGRFREFYQADIDIIGDGTIHIASADAAACDAAKKCIDDIVFVPEVGKLYYGRVVRLMQFGAFVEIAPGKDGLVHISKLDKKRVEKVEDVVTVGDMIWVKFMEIDEKGRWNLSRKDALLEIEAQQAAAAKEQ